MWSNCESCFYSTTFRKGIYYDEWERFLKLLKLVVVLANNKLVVVDETTITTGDDDNNDDSLLAKNKVLMVLNASTIRLLLTLYHWIMTIMV